MQMPSHAVAQQTPCAQWLLAHSASLEQVSRDGRMQLPFTQGGAVQSASILQVVRQVAVVVSQRNGAQMVGGATLQTLWPSQMSVPETTSP